MSVVMKDDYIIISKIYTFEIGLIYYYTVKEPGTGTRMG
jgi:hypothetical protein